METIKILMVDDHPMIMDGYINILNDSINENRKLFIDTVTNCDDAVSKVQSSGATNPYDIIYLDISLPPSKDLKIFSGEDLGLRIKTISPKSKIVVITMHNENMRIYNLMKNLNPDGLIIKSDIEKFEFFNAFERILAGNIYYSQTVNEVLRRHFTHDAVLDDIDRGILYHISKGIKTKDLAEVINLSLAAIEKRKRRMKESFGVEEGGDLVLIDKAKELGFL